MSYLWLFFFFGKRAHVNDASKYLWVEEKIGGYLSGLSLFLSGFFFKFGSFWDVAGLEYVIICCIRYATSHV